MTSILVLSVISLYVCLVQGQSCPTPTGSKGNCIPILDCPTLLVMVNNPRRTKEEVQLLRQSHCGFEGETPKVCCPEVEERTDRRCFTPEGNVGTCMGLHSCPNLLNLLKKPIAKEDLIFLQTSRCEGPDPYSVCCGPKTERAMGPSNACKPSVAPADPRTECCGLDSASGNRIFGGNVTAIDQYPWLAIIEYRGIKDNKIRLLCGGALISSKYVLTAGHCVAGPVLRVGTPVNVRLGEYDTSSDGPDCVEVEGGGQDCTEGHIVLPIEKVIPHKDYQPESSLRRHDIALLRLKDEAPYNDFIRPICLPTSDIALSKEAPMLVVSGWGAVDETKSSSNVKLQVDLPYIKPEECQKPYNVAGRKVKLWEGQLCAGGVEGKDSCKGDSGGPLMADNGRIYTAVGVVSFGPSPCGLENVPGVYTKVYQYLPWIRSQMKP